jgi:thiol-disulfide isomerase/thioredoxin
MTTRIRSLRFTAVAFVALAMPLVATNVRENRALAASKTAKLNVEEPYAAPEFVGLENWMNSKGQPVTLASLKGKVVIVDFWTFGCINCQRTLPHMNDLYTKYHDKGLEVIGVHTPEFDSERTTANVKTAIKRENIKFVVAQDNQNTTWNAYRNRFWPQFYFIDRQGMVRHTHIGEGGYDNADLVVAKLLAEKAGAVGKAGKAETVGNAGTVAKVGKA